ncbi:hypothetical protein QQ045_005438 [Rhodiola kirilowii]
MEGNDTSTAPDNGIRNDAEKVKKAKVRRNKKVQEPITIRESQVTVSSDKHGKSSIFMSMKLLILEKA